MWDVHSALTIPNNQYIEKYVGTPCYVASYEPLTWPVILEERRLLRPSPTSTRPWLAPKFWKRPTNWDVVYGLCVPPKSRFRLRLANYDYCTSAMKYGDRLQHLTASWWGNFLPSSVAYSDTLRNNVLVKALNKVKGQDVNLGLAFLERKETEDLLVGSLHKIARARSELSAIRRRGMHDVYSAYERRKALFGNRPVLTKREAALLRFPRWWLEFCYGLSPLMSDVHGAMIAVEKSQRSNLYSFHVRSSGRIATTLKTVRLVDRNLASGWCNLSYIQNESCTYRIDWELVTSGLPLLSTLGLTNPVDLVWERIPYSFIVDWFLPLGNWFNLMDVWGPRSFRGGSFTQWAEAIQPTWFIEPPTGWTVERSDVSSANFHLKGVRRTVLTSAPFPDFPEFKNPLSPTHVANALSLFVTGWFKGVPRGLTR